MFLFLCLFPLFWPSFHRVPVACDTQRHFTKMFQKSHVFDLTLFTSLWRLATTPSLCCDLQFGVFYGSECWNCLKTQPLSTVYQKPPCLPAPPSVLFRPGLKNKASMTVMHHPSFAPTPPPLMHGQSWQLYLIPWWGGRKKKSRQNTSSRGGRTEHGNSCGPAASQVQVSALVPDLKNVSIYINCSNYASVQVLTSFILLLVRDVINLPRLHQRVGQNVIKEAFICLKGELFISFLSKSSISFLF